MLVNDVENSAFFVRTRIGRGGGINENKKQIKIS